MNIAHLHLMLNHLPVVGAPMLLALLAYGLGRRLPEVTRVALWCTAALGVLTVVVYLTGESAEELIESLPTFDHDMVERHEAVALGATAVLVLTAALAAASLWAARRGGRLAATATRPGSGGAPRRQRGGGGDGVDRRPHWASGDSRWGTSGGVRPRGATTAGISAGRVSRRA